MTGEKQKHTIFLTDEVWAEIQSAYKADGCTKLSEFVEKAVRFYLGYHHGSRGAQIHIQRRSTRVQKLAFGNAE